MERSLRLGTRGSALARWQAEWVETQLLERTGQKPERVLITTRGDEGFGASAPTAGETGIFTKEIQRALLAGQIDIAVHSLKDLPTDHVPGLVLAAVPQRESPDDVLIARNWNSLEDLPSGARVGTSSLRRRAQLLHARPDLRIEDIRGNVDTRLKKLDAGDYDALVLAWAGLHRLGLDARVTERFNFETMLPAVGQGALGIEARADDVATLDALSKLDDLLSRAAVTAERTLLATLSGGCLAPIGAVATPRPDGQLHLRAGVCATDGQIRLLAEGVERLGHADRLGTFVAERLLSQGAAALIRANRGD